jgi:hypothetical protein
LEAIVTKSELKALRTPAEKKVLNEKILRTARKLSEPEPEIDRNMSCYDQKLTVMAKYIFGNQAVKSFTEGVKDNKGNWILKPRKIRDVWDLTDETNQCNNVIGQWKLGTDCWICGYVTTQSAKRQKRDSIGGAPKRKREPSEDDTTREKASGLEPSCEHILPIAQARFFLDLYNPSVTPSPELQEVRKLEYEWAHRYCNEIKGDRQYIKNMGTDNDPVWGADMDTITEDLDKIYTGLRNPSFYQNYEEGKSILLEKIGSSKITKNRWLQDRQSSMSTRMQAIADHINKGEKGLGRLIVLAGTANCMNPKNVRSTMIEIMKSFQEEIGPISDPIIIPALDTKAPYEDDFEDTEKDAISGLITLGNAEDMEEEEEPVSTIANALWFLKSTKAEDPPSDKWDFLFSSLSEKKGGRTRRNIRTKK